MEYLDKYNIASKICQKVLEKIKCDITVNHNLHIKNICEKGDAFIQEELKLVYKNLKHKFIAFPVSISLNNCVENYRYHETQEQYNIIKNNDIVKIKLGVNIDGCISLLEKTYEFDDDQLKEILINLEERCKKICEKNMFNENTNDEVRKMLEIELLQAGYKSIENAVSYQTLDSHLNTSESKYMILNYQKYYDEEGELVLPNNCFEFESGEFYNINLRFVKNELSLTTKIKHESHLYRFNEYFYNLKSKSGRQFYNEIIKNHNTNVFVYEDYKSKTINKIGFKESYENGILDELIIYYTGDNIPVYSFCFTVFVSNKRGIITN